LNICRGTGCALARGEGMDVDITDLKPMGGLTGSETGGSEIDSDRF